MSDWQHPFLPGHTVTLRHGAYSPRVTDPISAELVAGMHADDTVPYLREPAYQAGLWAWARAEAKVVAITTWLESRDTSGIADDGSVIPALNALAVWEKIAGNHRARLGLDPLSRARLGKDLASTRQADAVAMLTQMREDHERQQHAQVSDSEEDR